MVRICFTLSSLRDLPHCCGEEQVKGECKKQTPFFQCMVSQSHICSPRLLLGSLDMPPCKQQGLGYLLVLSSSTVQDQERV